jgi:KDO2-lipid IV(A) lauroyltransferase
VLARCTVLLVGLLGKLPFRACQTAGGLLGAAISWLPLRPVRITRVNLDLCFPDEDVRRRRRLLHHSLAHTGRAFLELGALWTWDRPRLKSLAVEVRGGELLDAARERGHGLLLLCPHLGAWEFATIYSSIRWPAVSLYRPPRVRELDAFFRRCRQRFGGELLSPGRGGVRELLRHLAAGKMAMVLPDQDAGEGRGVFVPFFGHLANTMVLVPRLASRARAEIFYAWAERLPRGRGYVLHYRRASPALRDRDLGVAARALNADLEAQIRHLPEQYLWSYKRFRIQPPDRRDPYREAGL